MLKSKSTIFCCWNVFHGDTKEEFYPFKGKNHTKIIHLGIWLSCLTSPTSNPSCSSCLWTLTRHADLYFASLPQIALPSSSALHSTARMTFLKCKAINVISWFKALPWLLTVPGMVSVCVTDLLSMLCCLIAPPASCSWQWNCVQLMPGCFIPSDKCPCCFLYPEDKK